PVRPVHRGRGRDLLPRLRGAAADPGLGQHALGEPRLPLRGVVAGRLPGRRARFHRARHQPGGRLAARRARSALPGLMAVVIRPCRPDEGPALLDLWHHADASPSPTDTPEQVDQVIQDPAASVLVAVDHDLLWGPFSAGGAGGAGTIYRLA